MTDNEIIKALDICSHISHCQKCPYYHNGCNDKLLSDTLALINRQKAEIEELREIVFMDRTEAIKRLKAEAVKEFAERLKQKGFPHCVKGVHGSLLVCEGDIDNLVKEFTEGSKR